MLSVYLTLSLALNIIVVFTVIQLFYRVRIIRITWLPVTHITEFIKMMDRTLCTSVCIMCQSLTSKRR